MRSNKKNDDEVIDVEEENNSFEFSQENEVPVQKPGPLEKRERRSKSSASEESRVVTSESQEYFDIE